MTITYSAFGGLFGAGTAATTASLVGASSNIVLYPVAIIGLTVGMVGWMYSPLPDSNGGLASTDPLRGRYWGIHPGNRWRAPDQVAPHETKARAIYYYGDEYLAIDVEHGAKAWGKSPDEANNELESLVSGNG